MLLAVLGTLGIVLIEASYVPRIARLVRRTEDHGLLVPALNLGARLAALGYAISIDELILSCGLLFGVGVRFTHVALIVHGGFVRSAVAWHPGITAVGEVIEARRL